jgi:hypothetical protein
MGGDTGADDTCTWHQHHRAFSYSKEILNADFTDKNRILFFVTLCLFVADYACRNCGSKN